MAIGAKKARKGNVFVSAVLATPPICSEDLGAAGPLPEPLNRNHKLLIILKINSKNTSKSLKDRSEVHFLGFVLYVTLTDCDTVSVTPEYKLRDLNNSKPDVCLKPQSLRQLGGRLSITIGGRIGFTFLSLCVLQPTDHSCC